MNPISPPSAGQRAEAHLAHLFEAKGWRVEREPAAGPYRPDLLVQKGRNVYVVEVKSISEGRRDRAIPLISQAILQVRAYAQALSKGRPLAVVYVGDATASVFKQLMNFSKDFAPDVAVGVISESGAQSFVGEGLEELNVAPSLDAPAKSRGKVSDIFSDLNQWMLKVLLAPEIPERLLAAPRAEYRNASDLANAANVSVMSAFRFARQLREEGFLDASHARLQLVRREDLFNRWRAAALRPSPEASMNFLVRAPAQAKIRDIVSSNQACLGLFAAADALQLGHVKGVPPYVYVRKLPRLDRDLWKGLASAAPGEPVDLILKQARAPQSVFRGAVNLNGVAVSDVLQIWLDVSAHPSRGAEQADLIYRKMLQAIIQGPSR